MAGLWWNIAFWRHRGILHQGIVFSGAEGKGENIKCEKGMNLTKEQQHGEVKQEPKMDGSLATIEFSDNKKSTIENDDTKNLQDEFVKAYYAALFKKQQELVEAAKKEQEFSNTYSSDVTFGMTLNRQVGMKSKRNEDEGDDDVEWDEASIAGNANGNYKVNDLNVQADASLDDEGDIDWEES